jgi:hypothetical protein
MALLVWIALALLYCWRVVSLFHAGWPKPTVGDTRIEIVRSADRAERMRRSG